MTSAPLWTPTAEQIRLANMSRYMRFIEKTLGLPFSSYDELYQWSVNHIDDFWESIWEYSNIRYSRRYSSVREGDAMPGTTWFPGAELNFAENLLRYRDGRPAIIYRNESGTRTKLSFAELHTQVARCAHGLRRLGVGKGDRVAAYITNRPETIIAMLAATSLGAVWSSCSPDFGFRGVHDRFSQIEPQVLFTVDSYTYNGRRFSPLETVQKLVDEIASIEHVVIVREDTQPDSAPLVSALDFDTLINNTAEDIDFIQLPFNHPVYIMYSSGTTGLPKCMVHGAGGTLLQHFKEHALHTNLTRDDIVTYYTTCGWMMWNWLVSVLQIGATVFLYDGSPSYPDYHTLWKAVDEEGVTVFGTSPGFLSACQNAGLEPGKEHDITMLRTILSTGSPLSVGNFEWVYQTVKPNVELASISGGTDIISCFILGNPILPIHAGEIQCRGLGMKVEAYDDDGKPVFDQVGELVCTAPFASMPVCFWNDPDNAKYRAAYFEHFPDVWRHGDYIRITPRGSVIVYGRSDATLNPGGVRIGTAEIYGPVESMSEIHDSIVVEQKRDDGSRIVLFVVTSDNVELVDELKDRIKRRIREQASPRHVPALILPIKEVPHTLNGKKVEVAVTKIVNGEHVANRDALANPDALDQFSDIPELEMI